jgi:hypothetical protein
MATKNLEHVQQRLSRALGVRAALPEIGVDCRKEIRSRDSFVSRLGRLEPAERPGIARRTTWAT